MSASISMTQAAGLRIAHLLGSGRPLRGGVIPVRQLAAVPARRLAAVPPAARSPAAPARPHVATPVLFNTCDGTLTPARRLQASIDRFAHLASPASPAAVAMQVIASADMTRRPMAPPPLPADPVARQVIESAALARTPRTATSMPTDPDRKSVV